MGNLVRLGNEAAPQPTSWALQGVRCRLTAAPSAVRVFGTVNGCPTRLVVDTGSKRTFVREGMVDARGVSEAMQLLCGVTGECTTMRGPMSVNVGMGNVSACQSS